MKKKIDQLVDIMDKTREVQEIALGFDMNYTPQSLKKLEQALVSMFGNREVRNEMAAMVGAYVGETIRRNIKGAEWKDFDEYVFDAHLIVPSKSVDGHIKVNPFYRVQKFMKDHTDGIYPFYCMVQDMSKGRLDFATGKVNENGGVIEGDSPRGYSYKVTAVPKDIHDRYEKGEITKEEMVSMAQKRGDN